jgi:nucleoside 2-deoxyribosyltransferase
MVDFLGIRNKFRSHPVVATAETRIGYRQITPADVMQAQAWIVAQEEQRRFNQAATKAANESIARSNATLSAMGASPMPYESAPPVDPNLVPDAMFFNSVQQVGTFRAMPAPTPSGFQQRARDVALGKVDTMTALRLLSADNPEAAATLPLLGQFLGHGSFFGGPNPFQELSNWLQKTEVGKFFAQFDPKVQAQRGFDNMARTAAVMALPLPKVFTLYAELLATPQGSDTAYELAMQEAFALQAEQFYALSSEVAWGAIEIGRRRMFSYVFRALELLFALPTVHAERPRVAKLLDELRPQAMRLGGDVAKGFARFDQMLKAKPAVMAAPPGTPPPPPRPPSPPTPSTPEIQSLIARRQQAADEHDRMRVQFPDVPRRSTVQFRNAMQPIVAELAEVARSMRANSATPAAEVARSLMWHGDALFDLGQGGHVAHSVALDAFKAAEPYVQKANDPVLAAKFDGNYANVLLRGDPNPASLREVIRRYESALRVPLPNTGYEAELAKARSLLAQFEEFDSELDKRRAEAKELLAQLPKYQLTPTAAAAIAQRLRELAEITSATTLADALQIIQRAHDAFASVMKTASRATTTNRQSGIAAGLMGLWGELASASMTATIDAALRDRMFETMRALVEIAGPLRDANDATALEIEQVRARPTAAAARQLLVHDHVTWLEPRWPAALGAALEDTVHIAGEASAEIVAVCRRRGLEVAQPESAREVGEARFDSIRRAAVVIVTLDGTARSRAAACYETGIALALGKQLVVIASDALPFDIDVEPITRVAELGDALDRATISIQRAARPANVDEILAAAKATFPNQKVLLQELAARRDEPLGFASTLENILRFEARVRTRILAYPVWPRRYPDGKRVFHVMPFREAWSNAIKDRARAACRDVTYRRHDDVADSHIIRSLWDELTLATHAIVDLTGWNLNVALELGALDALGTSTLLVGQGGVVQELFPMIKKTRVREYALDGDDLERAVQQFLQ